MLLSTATCIPWKSSSWLWLCYRARTQISAKALTMQNGYKLTKTHTSSNKQTSPLHLIGGDWKMCLDVTFPIAVKLFLKVNAPRYKQTHFQRTEVYGSTSLLCELWNRWLWNVRRKERWARRDVPYVAPPFVLRSPLVRRGRPQRPRVWRKPSG